MPNAFQVVGTETPFLAEYEHVPCPVCGSADYRPWRTLKGQPTAKCHQCHHVYANPRPTEATIIRAYALPEPEYKRFFRCETFDVESYQRSSHEWQQKTVEAHLQTIERLCPEKGRLLELGCSSGLLLEAAQNSGWEVAGVDPSEVSSRGVDIDERLNIRRTSLFDARFPDESFNFIFSASVLEHLTDPGCYLRELRRLLTRQGHIFIASLPNVRSFTILLGIDRYIGNHPPGHLQFFCRRTIRTLLWKTGFESVQCRVYGMPETILAVVFGDAAIEGAGPSPKTCLLGSGYGAAITRATRRAVYGAFDLLGIGSVMDVFAKRSDGIHSADR